MYVKNLSLKNFVIFKDVQVSFDNIGLTTINGSWESDVRRSNGSGKSALLESIPYALFGTTRSKQKADIVRRGADKCFVEIEILVNDRHIKIKRQRNHDGTSTAAMWVNGKQTATQIRAVDASVKEYIGLDQDLFELIYFFRQDDQFKFVNASPGERKFHLAKLFDFSAVEACCALAASKRKAAQEARQRAEGALEALHSNFGQLPPRTVLDDRLADLNDELCHYQLLQNSRQNYFNRVRLDIENGKLLLADFDEELNKKVVELRELDRQAEDGARQISSLRSLIQRDTAMLKQQREMLKSLDAKGNEKSALDWQKDIDELQHTESMAMSRMSKLDSQVAGYQDVLSDAKETAGKTCPTCRQIVTVEHCEHIATDAKKKIEQFIDERSKIAVNLASIREKLGHARDGRDQARKASHNARQIAQFQQSIKDLESSIRSHKKNLIELEENQPRVQERRAILASNINASGSLDLRNRIKSILDCLTMPSTDIDFDEIKLTSDISRVEESIKSYERLHTQIEDAEAALEKAKADGNVYEKLCEIFGRNGLQAIMIENLVNVIEQFANDILSQMQTRFEVVLRTQRTIQSGENRETLEVVVYDNGEERMFETYSGGERTLINLALRLSLSRIISSLHGIVMRSLFLDEVFAALDECNRQEAIKVLAFLSKSFDQVFVVSHTDEVKDIIPGHIDIRRFEDHSEVSITDGRLKAQSA